jgi:transposase InsO family protein
MSAPSRGKTWFWRGVRWFESIAALRDGVELGLPEHVALPARFLSDNAAVFSGKSRRGRVALESELDRLGIQCVHSTPYHPQLCGRVERFHQTLKLLLARQAPAQSIAHIQLQLDDILGPE